MNTRLSRLLCWITGVGLACAASAGSPLRHDPFVRPSMPPVAAPKTLAAADVEPAWNPALTAVMMAGKQSLANVDGAIIEIGQEKDGYRLVDVRDQEAIFIKGKQRIVLKMQAPVLRQNKDRATE